VAGTGRESKYGKKELGDLESEPAGGGVGGGGGALGESDGGSSGWNKRQQMSWAGRGGVKKVKVGKKRVVNA